ncbi:MAG TPA: phosphoribosyltransferase family protein [Propionibacteriaceae bacterium]|nr:phosphoribosyltransferase family protein [Propionibacteriaceae bacterium]
MTVSLWAAAADLLLGAQCPACSSPRWGLCPDCRTAVLAHGCYLTRPDPCPVDFPVTATTSPYDARMKRLVTAYKEHQVMSLTPFLAERLSAAVRLLVRELAPSGSCLVLVPVPSSPAAVRARGLDATWAMARRAVRGWAGGPAVDPLPVIARRLLGQSRRVQDQARLTAVARQQNLAGSFRVRGGRLPPGAAVVIVDDVVTTGASLSEAARALQAAQLPVLGAATVAATVRSAPPTARTQEDSA